MTPVWTFWKRISPRKRRTWREWLTAYAFLSPALLLIGLFGIWPVLFAVYVSLHKWRIRRGDFVGMTHYFKAVDVFGFFLFALTGVAFLAAGVLLLRRYWWREHTGTARGWVLAPTWSWAAAAWALAGYGVAALPHVLDIAQKAVGKRPTVAMFRQWLWEALTSPSVTPWFSAAVWLALVGLGVSLVLRHGRPQVFRQGGAALAWSALGWWFLGIGLLTLAFSVAELLRWHQALMAEEASRNFLAQAFSIVAGAVALGLSWKLWKDAVDSDSTRGFLGKALAALLFMIGAWILLMEVPPAIRAGDKDVWEGLLITTYYALGTVPFQLTIALFLALLLYQNLPGKEVFRVIYFLPYVTPTVASAAVFRLLFSPRPTAPVNTLLARLGLPAQRWLMEPRGIGQLLGEALGLQVPSWLHGPSLALVVIMIYSIWVFVGYDIVIYLAGLGNIPTELKEAAAIDGATGWQIFRHVTLPLLSPTIYFLSLIAVIGTFKAFNHIYVMREAGAQGTVDTLSLVIFDEFFVKTRFGYASALAFVLFAVILSLTYINRKVQESWVFYQ